MSTTAFRRASIVSASDVRFTLSGLLLAGAVAGCETPASPDCTVNSFWVHSVGCDVADAEVLCRFERTDYSRVCESSRTDLTNQAVWTTSDSRVGVITAPGRMTSIAPGHVQIVATLGRDSARSDMFAVAPNAVAELMYKLSVIAEDVAEERISGVDVEVRPDRGNLQTCVTEDTGSCQLWVLKSHVEVIGTKTGYQSARGSVTPSADPNEGNNLRVLLTLRAD